MYFLFPANYYLCLPFLHQISPSIFLYISFSLTSLHLDHLYFLIIFNNSNVFNLSLDYLFLPRFSPYFSSICFNFLQYHSSSLIHLNCISFLPSLHSLNFSTPSLGLHPSYHSPVHTYNWSHTNHYKYQCLRPTIRSWTRRNLPNPRSSLCARSESKRDPIRLPLLQLPLPKNLPMMSSSVVPWDLVWRPAYKHEGSPTPGILGQMLRKACLWVAPANCPRQYRCPKRQVEFCL